MFKRRASMAGEPLYDTPDDSGSGNAAPGNDGAGNNPSGGNDLFDKGFGKGVSKGKAEGMTSVLAELGVSSLDEAKALAKTAQDAQEAARKAAEEQGNFKSLYEGLKTEAEKLKERAAIADRYEEAQKAELATLTEKLTDDDKAMLDGMPVDRALAIAKRLSAQGRSPVGSPPAGNTPGEPGTGDAAMSIEEANAMVKKAGGWGNLKPEQRAQIKSVMERTRPGM